MSGGTIVTRIIPTYEVFLKTSNARRDLQQGDHGSGVVTNTAFTAAGFIHPKG